MRLSICSYTFNDGNLLDGLLDHLEQWLPEAMAARQWDGVELVVLDDGSEPRYALPSDRIGPARVRLLRHDRNLGFHKAKEDCLNAAEGDVILALDCDARPGGDWLGHALSHFDAPQVALVGGSVSYHAPSMGHGPTARYLNAFDEDIRRKERGPVDMVPGQAWLIRASAWHEAGGFGQNSMGCLEDHALGRRLRNLGHALMHEPDAHSFLVRKLSRRAVVKRFWAWLRHLVPGLIAQGQDPLAAFLGPMTGRLENAISHNELAFVYMELLYLAHAMHDVRAHAPALLAPVTPMVLHAMRGYPLLTRLFRVDLLRMGIEIPAKDPAGTDEALHPSPQFLGQMLANLEKGGIFTWLETEGVRQLAAEEANGEGAGPDFSAYESW